MKEIPKEIKKQISLESFKYAKFLYTHTKDEDIKESSQYDAYKDGAEFGYQLATESSPGSQSLIDRVNGLVFACEKWEQLTESKEAEIENLKKERDGLKESVSNGLNVMEEFEMQNHRQSEEIESLKKERDELKQHVYDFYDGNELKLLESEIEALKKENERLKEEVAHLHDCLDHQ